MDQKICIHCFVSGRVQGVWFRASTQSEAQALGLTGWVRNLSDGRVELMACGEEEKVEQLRKWLMRGPQMAKVEDLRVEKVAWEEFEDFKTV